MSCKEEEGVSEMRRCVFPIHLVFLAFWAMQYRPTFSFRSAAKRSSPSGLAQTASRNASYGPFSILLIMYQGKLRPLEM